MNDETMKNEKNLGVSDAAVSGPLWTHLLQYPEPRVLNPLNSTQILVCENK